MNKYQLSTLLFRKPSTNWPTPTQELLVRAAVLEGDDSFHACEEWLQRIAGKTIDENSRQLLPLLYKKFSEKVIGRTSFEILKKEYQSVRLRTGLLFQAARNPIQLLVEAGIPTMLLKGAALSIRYYIDNGLRPMDDVDVLVTFMEARAAIDLLKRSGWMPDMELSGPFGEVFMCYSGSVGLKSMADFALDINWHLINLKCAVDADQEYWAEAVPIEFRGIPLLALSPTFQLMHVCVHGMTHIPMSLKWIPDAAIILKRSSSDIDWDRLLSFVRVNNLVLPIRDTLFYLHDLLEMQIPEDVLTRLNALPTTVYEQREYYALTSCYSESGSLPLLWALYNRHTRDQTKMGAPTLSFLQYLQIGWRLDRIWKVPFYFLYRVAKRVWNNMSGVLFKR